MFTNIRKSFSDRKNRQAIRRQVRRGMKAKVEFTQKVTEGVYLVTLVYRDRSEQKWEMATGSYGVIGLPIE